MITPSKAPTKSLITQETSVALFLLMMCGVFIRALGDIELTNYGTITSEIWPTIVLSILTFLCGVYFIQSLIAAAKGEQEENTTSWRGFFPLNVCIVFVLFGLFVYTLPYLGMMIGGGLFVFIVLSLIGHRTVKYVFIHLSIAIGSVAVMWLAFSYGLNVMLPEGDLLYWLMY